MGKVIVKQVKSSIKRGQNSKRNLEALGLKGINSVVEHNDSEVFRGMLRKVNHLVEIIEE